MGIKPTITAAMIDMLYFMTNDDDYDHYDLTFNTGFDFSAMDLRSSMPALTATEVRADDDGDAGAKAAADPIKRERRESFMVEWYY